MCCVPPAASHALGRVTSPAFHSLFDRQFNEITGESLKIRFQGQSTPVAWHVEFTPSKVN